MTDALTFLRKVADHNGRIVDSRDVTEMELATAIVEGRAFEDEHAIRHYVFVPWHLPTVREMPTNGGVT